ncbi:secretin receptor-like [Haliotis asinina]|uniref:secretin receptor-like n=1 Tax=Haliotis asinina TaxID=109174 RepID=UPI003531952F
MNNSNTLMEVLELLYRGEQNRVIIGPEEQRRQITLAHVKCLQQTLYEKSTLTGPHCNRTWDDLMCWPPTRAGEIADQPCAKYVHGFNLQGRATRACTDTGEWFVNPIYNGTWTNYTDCYADKSVKADPTFAEHLARIRIMFNIGYGLSLASLTFAVFVVVYFRRLHCPRNIVHLNLFLSFMFRATLSILRDNLFLRGLGLPSDVIANNHGVLEFIPEGTHWQCKLLLTCFHYMLAANYMWIFVEGLYLHTLIIVAVFSERNTVRWYILLGWGGPLVFVIPWVAVRASLENKFCWNTNPTPGYFWIMKGPIVAILVGCFVFFVNVVRVLFTKLQVTRNSTPRARKYRYRRLAKSTLVLIPLFGVHYIIFVFVPDGAYINPTTELVRLYYELFFNSFQGFFVACLFCFCNGEVQSELRKMWIRHKLRTNSRKFQRIYWHASSSSARHKNNGNCDQKNKIKNKSKPKDKDKEVLSKHDSEPSSCDRKRFHCFYENGKCYRAATLHSIPRDVGPVAVVTKTNSFV